ncbi:MAG: sigma 54-interacting transcriptional regulator [Labilithrix sp.]|nr:sigma 54-interacting transcriptional regulator [Labilithrix sp.]
MSEDRTRSVAPRALDPSARLRLIVFCGGQVSSHAVPRAGELVLGRGEEAHVRIDHATVSRKHATITLGDEPSIVDHGSFNGTSIGGQKIAPNAPVALGIATIAELGETMVVLQVEGPSAVTGSRGLSSAPPRPEVSAAMQHLYRLVDNVAQSNITVIVRGETGAGKEVVAEEIHRRSPRATRELVKLNCAALPEHLLEGELFGYERGAFTGATAAKPGLIEVADGGTLFLDEVGELPPATQAKLLRVVESREVLRLGSLRPKAVDVRFVAATHRDLEEMVARGAFRQDLYYRLNGVSLAIPPLRERVDEIPRLANEFVGRFCRESKRPALPISDAALAVLKTYGWPGNVRELRNVMERAIVFCRTVAIAPDHLGLPLDRTSRPPHHHPSAPPPPHHHPSAPPPPHHHPSSPPPYPPSREPSQPPGMSTVAFGSSLPAEVDALERERILAVLAQCGGNQTQAAEMLGISRRTLLRRLDEYAVPRPRKA